MARPRAAPPNQILARLDVRTTLSKKFNDRNRSPCSSQTGGRGGRKLGRSRRSCSAHLKEIFFGGTRGGGKTDGVLGWRSKRSARALIICDFKEMDRLPMASGFSAIQNNSDVSQGLGPRLAAQSATRAVGILMPL